MIFATVPSCANTTSVMPPTYSLSSAPSTSGAAVSTSEVKPVMSVKMVATSRRCTSIPLLSPTAATATEWKRSEEHTSELQSHLNLVCPLLLEKKNTNS